MIVGVPAETKKGEHRVALTPDGARELVAHGHQVLVETGAGEDSSIPNAEYAAAGASIVIADDAWTADLVVKVKEPQPDEYRRLRAETGPVHLPPPGRLPGGGRRPPRRPAPPPLAYETVQVGGPAGPCPCSPP